MPTGLMLDSPGYIMNVLCSNVHTGLRQRRDQDPLFPVVPVPFPVPVLVPYSVRDGILGGYSD